MQTRYKYPRTPHLPWSPGATSDDKTLDNVDHFIGKRVIITEKMDGENTTLYNDGLHARSINSKHHPSRSWIKVLQASIRDKIEEDTRICGENLYAKHSIPYANLTSYFYAFSFWRGDYCVSWATTYALCDLIFKIPTPSILYDGIFDPDLRIELDETKQEGYVIRLEEGFFLKDFNRSIAKYVRSNHIQTDNHWMKTSVVKNKLVK